MTDFIDLAGASGAAYRFRRAEPQDLPVMAGNVVVVVGQGARRKVLFCGTARSLADATSRVRDLLAGQPGAGLYVRLNVARATREAEHADLAAGLAPDAETGELG